jgi:hypothetical protein
MKNFDITGQTFGSLTVVGRTDEQRTRSVWNCLCVCGKPVICTTGNLRSKTSTKCQCAFREGARKRQTKHALNRTPEHRTWSGMKNRFENPLNRSYPQYGGSGITVDPSWQLFETFLADMGTKPSPKHSLDRYPDQNGPYSPENCRWATRLEQANNKRNNHELTFNGKSMNISQWAREIGISEDTLERRINLLGWPTEKALTKPVRDRGW